MSELAHSKWSASKFESLMLCPGKIVLEAGLPNSTSKYAAEGTVAHLVLTWALQQNVPASAFIGRTVEADGFTFEVDDDMARHVQVTLDYVAALAGDDGVVLVDQRVNYSRYLGVPESEAWGTLDVAVLRGDEVVGLDLKYGMGVEVDAERNPQVSLYVLGILSAVQGLLGDFTRARLAISQPRIKVAPSEWSCTVAELEEWGYTDARHAVRACSLAEASYPDASDGATTWYSTHLAPSEAACKFCKAKATCPKLRDEVATTTAWPAAHPDEFAAIEPIPPGDVTDEAWLAACLSRCDLIEDWCKAIRAEVERRLLAGQTVPGYKLVQGKKGNRQWRDAKAVEDLLKSMRLKQEEMYDFKLISPTTADKLHKAGTIGPRQWPKLQEFITQSEGGKHVAPLSDSRPALEVTPVVEDFTDLTSELA